MDWIATTSLAISVLLALGAGAAKMKYDKVKAKLTAIRNFMVQLDDALADDNVTEEEFREIYRGFREIVM